jgi:cytochrome P450 family 142 subfamily A polypeptide 1
MRAEGPVWRDEKNDLCAVVQHAPLIDVERNAEVFSSSGCYRSRVAPQEEDMIAKDDPAHHEQRALVARRFTPKAVQALERVVDATVEQLVDGFIDRGSFDAVDDLAAPFPAQMTAHLLGFGPELARSVRSWSERLMRIDAIERDPDVMMGTMTAIQEFATELGPLVEDRRETPRDDLVSIWANAELGGCPVDTSVLVQENGPVHLGRCRDDADCHRARPRRADASSRGMGSDGGETRGHANRGRRDHPLGDATQQHVPNRHA